MEKIFRLVVCCAKSAMCRTDMVGDGCSVQSTIVATGSPAVFFLGDEVEGRSPGLSERRAVPFRIISSNSDFANRRRSDASRRGREVTGGPYLVQRH